MADEGRSKKKKLESRKKRTVLKIAADVDTWTRATGSFLKKKMEPRSKKRNDLFWLPGGNTLREGRKRITASCKHASEVYLREPGGKAFSCFQQNANAEKDARIRGVGEDVGQTGLNQKEERTA